MPPPVAIVVVVIMPVSACRRRNKAKISLKSPLSSPAWVSSPRSLGGLVRALQFHFPFRLSLRRLCCEPFPVTLVALRCGATTSAYVYQGTISSPQLAFSCPSVTQPRPRNHKFSGLPVSADLSIAHIVFVTARPSSPVADGFLSSATQSTKWLMDSMANPPHFPSTK